MTHRRILIFSLVYYPRYIGGAEVAVKEITDRISPSDIEFDMVTMRKHAPAFERIGNVNVYRVGMPWRGRATGSSKIFPLLKYLFIPLAFLKARKLNKSRHYDMTWSIMANYAGFAALFFKMTHPRIPFLLTLQEGDPFDHIKKRVGLLYPVFKKIFARADHIQAISAYLAEWGKDMGARCPIDVVPNGVDYALFSQVLPNAGSAFGTRAQIRSELGFSESDTVLVTASRLVKKNAVDDIIRSLEHLDASYKALIIGKGADEAALKALVAELKLERRVAFKGFVPHADLPRYLKASDIFIRPSLSEGLGNSFLEAMAARIPVIATPVGGIPDFLTDGETGLFCEVANPKSIAQKAEKLSKDKESREYIVDRADAMVKKRYTWDIVVENMYPMLAGEARQDAV